MRSNNKIRIMTFTSMTLILITIFGTAAYFIAVETAHNVISTSGVGIALYDLSDPDGELVPFSKLTNVYPGETYSKIPYVENNEVNPVWVRASVELRAELKTGETVIIPEYGELVVLNEIGSNWRENDKMYYYEPVLYPGEKTTPFFTSVKFKEEIPDSFQDAKFILTVKAEATQTANNGDSALTANWGMGE